MQASKQNSQYAIITIESLNDLGVHEATILKRISTIENGGQLFIIHPFRLLAEVGVSLSEVAQKEILNLNPQI